MPLKRERDTRGDRPRRSRDKVVAVVIVAVLVLAAAGGAAAFVLLRGDGGPAGGADAPLALSFEDLAPMEVEVEIELTRPDRDDAVFSGQGAVVPDDGVAELTFTVDEVPNAAGFWGHHDAIDLVYQGTSALAEVVPGRRPWLQIEPEVAGPATGTDIARMREMFLANPALAVVLLEQEPGALVLEGDGSYRGDVALGGELAAIARSFGTEAVELQVVARGGALERIVETWRFPVVPGVEAEAEVVITLDLEEAEGVDIELPPDGRRRSLQEMIGS